MMQLLRIVLVTVGLGAGTCAAQSVPIDFPPEPSAAEPSAGQGAAPGWQHGGAWQDSPQSDDDEANDDAIENQARQTDAEITTDYPAAAEPLEDPADIPYDEPDLD